MVDQVAAALAAHPEIRKVRIEGHTDDSDTERHDQGWSQRRAEVVRQALVRRGVAPSRLETAGFGPSRPLVPNTSEENRQRNRRVECLMLEREQVPRLAVPWGPLPLTMRPGTSETGPRAPCAARL